jgi:hypothetical protein
MIEIISVPQFPSASSKAAVGIGEVVACESGRHR